MNVKELKKRWLNAQLYPTLFYIPQPEEDNEIIPLKLEIEVTQPNSTIEFFTSLLNSKISSPKQHPKNSQILYVIQNGKRLTPKNAPELFSDELEEHDLELSSELSYSGGKINKIATKLFLNLNPYLLFDWGDEQIDIKTKFLKPYESYWNLANQFGSEILFEDSPYGKVIPVANEGQNFNFSHIYNQIGNYTIEISAQIYSLRINSIDEGIKIKSISQWGTSKIYDISNFLCQKNGYLDKNSIFYHNLAITYDTRVINKEYGAIENGYVDNVICECCDENFELVLPSEKDTLLNHIRYMNGSFAGTTLNESKLNLKDFFKFEYNLIEAQGTFANCQFTEIPSNLFDQNKIIKDISFLFFRNSLRKVNDYAFANLNNLIKANMCITSLLNDNLSIKNSIFENDILLEEANMFCWENGRTSALFNEVIINDNVIFQYMNNVLVINNKSNIYLGNKIFYNCASLKATVIKGEKRRTYVNEALGYNYDNFVFLHGNLLTGVHSGTDYTAVFTVNEMYKGCKKLDDFSYTYALNPLSNHFWFIDNYYVDAIKYFAIFKDTGGDIRYLDYFFYDAFKFDPFDVDHNYKGHQEISEDFFLPIKDTLESMNYCFGKSEDIKINKDTFNNFKNLKSIKGLFYLSKKLICYDEPISMFENCNNLKDISYCFYKASINYHEYIDKEDKEITHWSSYFILDFSNYNLENTEAAFYSFNSRDSLITLGTQQYVTNSNYIAYNCPIYSDNCKNWINLKSARYAFSNFISGNFQNNLFENLFENCINLEDSTGCFYDNDIILSYTEDGIIHYNKNIFNLNIFKNCTNLLVLNSLFAYCKIYLMNIIDIQTYNPFIPELFKNCQNLEQVKNMFFKINIVFKNTSTYLTTKDIPSDLFKYCPKIASKSFKELQLFGIPDMEYDYENDKYLK